jgi:GR25 family glycosyltransferase involved in LPS biosynthesis
MIEAIYPAFIRVPFLNRMIAISKQRTGRAQLPAEIGCLLSHRIVWQKIVTDEGPDNKHFLVLESDSEISDLTIMDELKGIVENDYDLFFWGAWLGHLKLTSSSKKRVNATYTIGEPFIKTVYCTYGYSLNKAGAAYLLKNTKKVAYPVDQFKKFVQVDKLRIGGIVPEIIHSGNLGTYINQVSWNNWQRKWILNFLDIKNNLICLFK